MMRRTHRWHKYAIARGVSPSAALFPAEVVDTEWFKPSDRLPERPVTLVAVGRLVRTEAAGRFISILHRLRNEFRLNVRG